MQLWAIFFITPFIFALPNLLAFLLYIRTIIWKITERPRTSITKSIKSKLLDFLVKKLIPSDFLENNEFVAKMEELMNEHYRNKNQKKDDARELTSSAEHMLSRNKNKKMQELQKVGQQSFKKKQSSNRLSEELSQKKQSNLQKNNYKDAENGQPNKNNIHNLKIHKTSEMILKDNEKNFKNKLSLLREPDEFFSRRHEIDQNFDKDKRDLSINQNQSQGSQPSLERNRISCLQNFNQLELESKHHLHKKAPHSSNHLDRAFYQEKSNKNNELYNADRSSLKKQNQTSFSSIKNNLSQKTFDERYNNVRTHSEFDNRSASKLVENEQSMTKRGITRVTTYKYVNPSHDSRYYSAMGSKEECSYWGFLTKSEYQFVRLCLGHNFQEILLFNSQDFKRQDPHQVVQNRPNIFLFFSVESQGKTKKIGAFTYEPFTYSNLPSDKNYAFILDITNKQKFDCYKGSDSITYLKDCLIWGKNQIEINTRNLTFSTAFCRKDNVYWDGKYEFNDFLGKEFRDLQSRRMKNLIIKRCSIYQIQKN